MRKGRRLRGDNNIYLIDTEKEALIHVPVKSCLSKAASRTSADQPPTRSRLRVGFENKGKAKPTSLSKAKDIMHDLYSYHVQTFHELGRIRTVGRTIAEGLLAEFSRLQVMVSEDAMCSLRTFERENRCLNEGLTEELQQLLQSVPDCCLRGNVLAAINRHSRNVAATTLLPKAQFDAVQREMKAFLERRLHDVSAQQETKTMVEACVERFTTVNFETRYRWVSDRMGGRPSFNGTLGFTSWVP